MMTKKDKNKSEFYQEKPILLIGPIAPPQWGPAVRNRIMLDTFIDWGIDVTPLNTLSWKEKPLGFILKVIKNVWKTPRVVISVSRNGRFFLLPLLVFIGLFRKVRIAFIPAGGFFASDMKALPSIILWIYLKIVKRCDIVYVQRSELAEQLYELGLPMPTIMPNFKVTPNSFPQKNDSEKLRLIFLSRIRPEKGIESLLEGLDILVKKGYKFQIDFYGILQSQYELDFQTLLKNRPFAFYKGVIEYSNVISSISGYDIKIFPTLRTEGFPGVLADAALAGLPVVASNLLSNREIIDDGFNGLLFRPEDPDDIAKKLEMLFNDKKLRLTLAKNNRIRGEDYDVKIVLKKFVNELQTLGWWK